MSFRSTFESDDVPTPKESGFFSMLGSRAVWHKGWKAVSVHPTIAGWGHFDEDRWELYDTDEDPTESHDLAAEHPAKLQELIDHWFHLAGLYNGLPLLDKTAVEVLADPTRPQVAPPRDRYVYYPDAAEVPETAAVNIRNRSYSIAVEVEHRLRGRLGRAVLARRALRRALAVREGPQAQVRLQLRRRQRADGRVDEGDPDRARRSSARRSCARATTMPTTGTLSLFIDDEKVGEGKIMTQPGNFSLVGEGLNVGRDPGEPVTDDYAGDAARTRSPAARSRKRSSTSPASSTSTSSSKRSR